MENSAFSLVELSIVLVILGLLTGGILTGQSLIRAAELRSVITEFQNYQTAIITFRNKYLALPGDITNATDFWTAADADHATCIALDDTSPSTGTETCNGNGNGMMGNDSGPAENWERFRAWQHLANAKLIEGSYTGVQGAGGNFHSVIGENTPNSKLGNAGYTIRHLNTEDGSGPNHFSGPFGNLLEFGAETTGGNNTNTANPAISPEEAWNIDQKVDDGRPAYGKVHARKNSSPLNPNCTTTDISSTSEYNLTDTATRCSLILLFGL